MFAGNSGGVEELLEVSEGIPRYLPDRDKFLKYASESYFEDNPPSSALSRLLLSVTGDSHLSEILTGDIRMMISAGAEERECLMMLSSCGIELSGSEYSSAYEKLRAMRAVCPLWSFRGNSHMTMTELRVPRRNDRCPCGSGLKHKKCCAGK